MTAPAAPLDLAIAKVRGHFKPNGLAYGQLESERDRLRSRVEELEEDLIDIPDVAK